ncbi:hypothetical protein [Clostridium sp. YIM B02551]|uniref:hypothetical protein n=1 Tax=Clostridium sp. YIM B02551 TaxID=2910679 RepID=UPI001EEC3ADF|nr:hypothetical protein [Clostridium sp. YIM B02551]
MIHNSIPLEIMTIDELANYITKEMDISLQLKIVGDEFYYSFISFDETKRKDIILSSLTQMPEDDIEKIIRDGN